MRQTQVGMSAVGMRVCLGLAVASLLFVTTACTGVQDATPTPSSASPSPVSVSPSPAQPASPEYDPAGTADDNLAYFDAVNSTFLAANAMPGGRAIVDNLVAAGFDKTLMQVTPDATSIGGAVDSVQFSVRFADRCLIGQTSGSVGYVATVGPVSAGASCLVGITRAIDW